MKRWIWVAVLVGLVVGFALGWGLRGIQGRAPCLVNGAYAPCWACNACPAREEGP